MISKSHSRGLVLFTLICCSFIMAGCGLLAPVAEQLAKGADKYCATLSLAERQLISNSINPTTDGHNVHVHCLGDPPVTP